MTSKIIEVLKTLKTAPLNETYFYNGTTYYTEDYVVTLITEKDQELQKAREESVKALDVADNDIPPFPSAKDSESARIGFITGVAWARTRLHSELDQDKL